MFTASMVRVRRDASRRNFLDEAVGKGVVHLAAHAKLDAIDPIYSAVLMTGGIRPGRLEAKEIAMLDLRATKLLTLSACDSGLGRVSRGDDFYGFHGALMAAGAQNIVVSMWPVDDSATQTLMTDFYASATKTNLGNALQSAIRKMASTKETAHPFFWAPFRLVSR